MSLRTNWQEPSSTHRCECSRAQKLALNSGTTGGARKMASIPPEKHIFPKKNRHNVIAAKTATGTSTTTGTAPAAPPCTPVVGHNEHVNDLVQELHDKQRLCMTQGRSQPSKNCKQTSTKHGNCGTSTVFCSVTQMHLSSQQRALSPCSRTAPVVATTGMSTGPELQTPALSARNGHEDNLVQELPRTLDELQLRNTTVCCTSGPHTDPHRIATAETSQFSALSQYHRDLPLRQDTRQHLVNELHL